MVVNMKRNIEKHFKIGIIEENLYILKLFDLKYPNLKVLTEHEKELFNNCYSKLTNDENEVIGQKSITSFSIIDSILQARLSKENIEVIDDLRSAYTNYINYRVVDKNLYDELHKIKIKLAIKKELIKSCDDRLYFECDYINASYNLIDITLIKSNCKKSFKAFIKEIFDLIKIRIYV
jgi:hypothetical protein